MLNTISKSIIIIIHFFNLIIRFDNKYILIERIEVVKGKNSDFKKTKLTVTSFPIHVLKDH